MHTASFKYSELFITFDSYNLKTIFPSVNIEKFSSTRRQKMPSNCSFDQTPASHDTPYTECKLGVNLCSVIKLCSIKIKILPS